MFGLAAGIAIVLVAAVLGAIVAFGLGRTLGRDAVQRFTGTRVARVDALLRRRGILAVIGLRLVPVVPFTAVNYAAGLTSVGVRDYVLGTAVGIVPGTVAYVALGVYGTEPDQWPFVAAVIVLLALSIGGPPSRAGHGAGECRPDDSPGMPGAIRSLTRVVAAPTRRGSRAQPRADGSPCGGAAQLSGTRDWDGRTAHRRPTGGAGSRARGSHRHRAASRPGA